MIDASGILPTIKADGSVPSQRIEDAKSLNEVVTKLIRDDDLSARNRADVQKMLDGAPPFNEGQLQETGQGDRCNLNFGDGAAALEAALAGYHDLTDSVDSLVTLRTTYGDESERTRIEGVIAEEFHRMVKAWPAFEANFQLLCHQFIAHGVGVCYFEDEYDWRWRSTGLNDFKVPRGVRTHEGDCEVAIVLRELNAGQLYKFIRDLDPEDKRWNVEEVKKALLRCNGVSNYTANNWEKLQQQLKNNDLHVSTTANANIEIVHVWVQEFSGEISHYITLRDGSNEDFLFKQVKRFDSVNQCYTLFAYGIGTNGTLHSVRGLAHKIYPFVQVTNKLRCQLVDGARMSGSLLLQPSEGDLEDISILYYGGCAFIPPTVKPITSSLPNVSSNVLPVVNDLSMTMQNNTGSYRSRSVTPDGQGRTKFEVQAQLQSESVMSAAAVNLFYLPWERLLREMFRRVQNKDLTAADPGGREVYDFYIRCEKRGVPREAIFAVDQVRATRAIGYGSPGMRLVALDEFMQYSGGFDPLGQNNLLRDRVALRVGWSQVDRYVPKVDQGGRAPVDVEIAELQNALMSMGNPATVLPNDQHILHVQGHLPSLESDLYTLESGGLSPELLTAAKVKAEHIGKHMEMVRPDAIQKKLVSELQRQFNNLAERVQAAQLHAERTQARQEQAAPPMTPELQAKIEAHQIDQRMRVEDHQLRQQIRAADAAQRQAIADARAAAKLRAEAEARRQKEVGSAPY